MMDITAASLLVAGLGVASVGAGTYNYRTQKQAIKDSTTVLGTVLELDIEERTRESKSYYPRIEYEYEYLGESYTGDSLYPGSLDRGLDSEEKAEDLLDGLEEDGEVSIHVNKNDPSQSFVFRETTTFRNTAAVVVGLFFILFGLFVV